MTDPLKRHPVPDSRGINLYHADPDAAALFRCHLPAPLFTHLEPSFIEIGALAGGQLDEWAALADRHPPTLSVRSRAGIDESRIDKHPAYVEMERLAFGRYGLAAMSHRAGVLGWPEPMPPMAKYALTYLFVQGGSDRAIPAPSARAGSRPVVPGCHVHDRTGRRFGRRWNRDAGLRGE